jgi:hypothetical protein
MMEPGPDRFVSFVAYVFVGVVAAFGAGVLASALVILFRS